METKKIVNLLRGLGKLCLVFGVIGFVLGVVLLFTEDIGTGPALVLTVASALTSVLGFVTYSAMANMMEAIDSIADTNKKIAETLDKQNISSAKTTNGYDSSLPPM